MGRAALLARGRRAAERLMDDRCTITRARLDASDEPILTTDADGAVIAVTDVAYGPDLPPHFGRCKVQESGTQTTDPEAGGHTFSVHPYRLDLPVALDVTGYSPQIGDVAHIDVAAFDPHLAGRDLRVVTLLHKTHATAYRLGADAMEGP